VDGRDGAGGTGKKKGKKGKSGMNDSLSEVKNKNGGGTFPGGNMFQGWEGTYLTKRGPGEDAQKVGRIDWTNLNFERSNGKTKGCGGSKHNCLGGSYKETAGINPYTGHFQKS